MPPFLPADNVLVSGVRINKSQHDTSQRVSESLIIPSFPPTSTIALADKSLGSLFMFTFDLYLGTGTQATKIRSTSPFPAGNVIQFEDLDNDTFIRIDNGFNNDQILFQSVTSTSANAIGLSALSGGINFGTNVTPVTIFDVLTSGQISLNSTQSAVDAIRIYASDAAGGIDIDSATGGFIMDSSGQIAITTTKNTVNAMRILTSGTRGIDIDAGSLGIAIDSTGPSHLSIGAVGSPALTLSSTADSVLISGGEAAVDSVQINSSATASGIDINSGSNGATIDSSGAIVLTSTQSSSGAISIRSSEANAGGVTITCGTGGLTIAPVVNVTQLTNITTAVTANGQSGVITTVSATTGIGATESFTVNNTRVTTSSNIRVKIIGYGGTPGTDGTPIVTVDNRASGSFQIYISNISTTTPLSNVLNIGYLILN